VFKSTYHKFILTFSLILLPLLACALGASHVEKARDAVAEGDTAKAFEEYRLALEEDDLEPSERFTALVERGDLYREQQDWDEALADYEAALLVTNEDGTPAGDQNSAYSRQFETLMERADQNRTEENWDAALADYEAALTLTKEQGTAVGDPNSVYEQRVELYVALQDWAAAVEDLDVILANQPDNYEALARRGYAHLQLRNFEQAIDDLKASLQGNVAAASADLDSKQNLVNAYLDLGNAMLDLGEYEEAVNNYNESLAVADNDDDIAEILAARGFVYSETGVYEKALADLNQALELKPDMALAYAYRSYIYGDQEDYEASIADATKAVELGTDLSDSRRATIIHARALAYLSTEQYELAVEDATESIRLSGEDNPNTARTYNIRSRANRLLGNYQQAIEDASRAIELGATDVVGLSGFYRSRAYAYYYVGENAAALDDLEAAISLDANQPNSDDYDLMGQIQYQQGDFEGSLQSYEQALSIAPEDPWLHNGRGDAYYELDDMENAEASYRAAVEFGPDIALFHENLGLVLRLTERYDEAIESYNMALSLDDGRPYSWLGRGLAHYSLTQDAEAISDLETALTFDLSPDLVDFIEGILAEIKP